MDIMVLSLGPNTQRINMIIHIYSKFLHNDLLYFLSCLLHNFYHFLNYLILRADNNTFLQIYQYKFFMQIILHFTFFLSSFLSCQ